MSPVIHPTAIVSAAASLGADVEIGPYCVVGDRVTVGEGTRIGPFCQIEGPTTIGRNNHLVGHAAVGTIPQDLKYAGEESFLVLGDDNKIREFVTINRGTSAGLGKTVVGSRNLLMTGVHVAHDCVVGSDSILANAATLAGHVTVQDFVTVGAFSGVHQFCRIGCHAFIGGYSVLTRDVLPFVKTVGVRNDARIYGINSIGLVRCGFSRERVDALKAAYRTLFMKGLRLQEAVAAIREKEVSPDVEVLLTFILASDRGVVRGVSAQDEG